MKNFTICLLLFLPMLSFCQTVTVSEGISIRNDDAYNLLGDLKGNLLLFRDKNTEYKVQSFDENLKLKWEKEIELDKKRPELLDVISTKNEFYILYHFKHKGDLMLKIHKYDPAANLTDSVLIKNFGTLFTTPKFQTAISENEENLLIWSVEDQNKFGAMGFSLSKLEVLWEKEFIPDDVYYGRDFRDMLMDDRGHMHLILERDNRKIKQETHRFEAFEYGPETNDILRRYTISMQGHLTYDVFFSNDNLNRRLIAGGLYSDDNRGKAEGIYYLNADPRNPDDHTLVFHPFDDQFVATLLEKENKKNKGLPEVTVQEIVLRRDGGILLVGELNKIFERRGGISGGAYDKSGQHFIRDYYFDDVFIISIHPTGEIHWKNVLHKKQYSQDDDAIYSSYFMMKTPRALRIIFNDEIKYENTVSEYVIKGDGGYDRNAVMSTENQQLRLRFKDAIQIRPDEIIVPSERRSRLKLVRVKF